MNVPMVHIPVQPRLLVAILMADLIVLAMLDILAVALSALISTNALLKQINVRPTPAVQI